MAKNKSDGEYPDDFEEGLKQFEAHLRRKDAMTQGDRALDDRARREGYFNRKGGKR